MAKKPTVTTVTSGHTSATTINSNFQSVRDAFDNFLSLDGATPNDMAADLNMDGNDILNAGSVQADFFNIGGSAIDLTDLQALNGIGANVTTLAHLEDGTVLTNGLSDLAGNADTLVANLSGLNSFAERYNVSATTPSSPAEGDLWYDTVNNVLKYYNGSSWVTSAGVSADEKIKISSNDTTEDYLLNKLVAGSNISLTETNDGANEDITIAVTGLGALGTLNTVGASEIDSDAVTTVKVLDANITNAKLADMATSRIKGRATAGTGVPEDLTAAQVLSMLGFKSHTSSSITLGTGNQQYTVTHGLSAVPTEVTGYLKCIHASGDVGWSQNDIVFLKAGHILSFGGGAAQTIDFGADSTTTYITQDETPIILNKSSSAPTTIDATKWELYVISRINP